MSSEETFDQWCILEILGHQRYAGRVREETIAGTAFIRLDVPAHGKSPAFTKYFGGASIYAISPVTEEIARKVAANFRKPPVEKWEFKDDPAMIDVDDKQNPF